MTHTIELDDHEMMMVRRGLRDRECHYIKLAKKMEEEGKPELAEEFEDQALGYRLLADNFKN